MPTARPMGFMTSSLTVFNALDGGSQQGTTVDVNDVDVSDGYFTVALDFGSAVFTGDARWLEIAVRPGTSSDPCDFATLSPRQEVTPAPYALYAGGDGDWTISGDDMYSAVSGNVGIGTTVPRAKLEVVGGDVKLVSESTRVVDDTEDAFSYSVTEGSVYYPERMHDQDWGTAGYVTQLNANPEIDVYEDFNIAVGIMNATWVFLYDLEAYCKIKVYSWNHNSSSWDLLYEANAGGSGIHPGSPISRSIHASALGGSTLRMRTWLKAYGTPSSYAKARYYEGKLEYTYAKTDLFVDSSTHRVGIGTNDPNATLDVNGSLILQNGSTINEFSTDGTLGDNSDDAVPTEKAVKTYVDNQIPVGGIGVVPVGGIVAWLKSFPNTPALPGNFVECNGQTLSDPESIYNGQTISNLNSDNRFLRGSSTSGGSGGSDTHTHTIYPPVTNMATRWANGWEGGHLVNPPGSTLADLPSSFVTDEKACLPSYYEVVWIIRVK